MSNHDHPADFLDRHTALSQFFYELPRRGIHQRPLTSSLRIVEKCAVLGDDQITKANLRKCCQQWFQQSTGDEHHTASRLTQPYQGIDCRIVDQTVGRQRPVIVDGQEMVEHAAFQGDSMRATLYQVSGVAIWIPSG